MFYKNEKLKTKKISNCIKEAQISNFIILDNNYSTTKIVTQEKPIISKYPNECFESSLFSSTVQIRNRGLRSKGFFKTTIKNKPLLSIITVTYNCKKDLTETIESVIHQTYDNIEYIIIDGMSNDGTIEIIEKYNNQIDYWLSEPDNGIYDAMNKGIMLSTGDFIGFINAGDIYYLNAMGKLSSAIINNNFDFTFGSVDIINDNSKIINVGYPLKESNIVKDKLKRLPTPHQSFFIKLSFLKHIGLFNTKYKIKADYDLILRSLAVSQKIWFFTSSPVMFRTGGVSSSLNTHIENLELLKDYDINIFSRYKIFIVSSLKYFISRIIPSKLLFIIQNRDSKNE